MATRRSSRAFLTSELPRTGNGAHEIRDWVIAHAAAGSTGFELIDDFPSPATFVGAGFASWKPVATVA